MKILLQKSELDNVFAARTKSSRLLRFPAGLEEDYQTKLWKSRRRGTYMVCLFSILVVDLFLISDYFAYPKFFLRAAIIRLAVFTPAALLGATVDYLRPEKTFRQISQMVVIVVTALSLLAIVRGISEVASMGLQAGLILVVIFGSLVLRLSFPFAVTTNLIVLAADLAFLLWGFGSADPIRVSCFFLIATSALLSLLANFRLEQTERSNYLLLLREEVRGHELAQMNRTLADLSNIDGLTGVANRRRLNEVLEAICSSTHPEDKFISIIMADLDHFKSVNDTAGHLYGDQVLQHFARILQRSVRTDRDLVARFGGEEFLIMLPNVAEEQAAEVAEQLRLDAYEELAKDLPIPGLKISVSFGVATTLIAAPPWYSANSDSGKSSGARGAAELIASADQALYRAKRSGRNCVCRAGFSESISPGGVEVDQGSSVQVFGEPCHQSME